MPAKVVDASVIAAWAFGEKRADEALELFKDYELHAPLLLAYELTSITRRKTVAYPERAAALSEALQTALAIPILWSDIDHKAVLHLALEANITTYDACYLYLAQAIRAPLVTFDQQLARAAGRG